MSLFINRLGELFMKAGKKNLFIKKLSAHMWARSSLGRGYTFNSCQFLLVSHSALASVHMGHAVPCSYQSELLALNESELLRDLQIRRRWIFVARFQVNERMISALA